MRDVQCSAVGLVTEIRVS